jgi:hypothetical protein
MEHEEKELRKARRLGVQQAEDINWSLKKYRGEEDVLTVEDAIENNPYSDPVLSRKYWQGYLAEVEKEGGLDYLLEEVHKLTQVATLTS